MKQQETLQQKLRQCIQSVKQDLLADDEAREKAWQKKLRAYEEEAKEADECDHEFGGRSRPEWEITREANSEAWLENVDSRRFDEEQRERLIDAAKPLLDHLRCAFQEALVQYNGDPEAAIEHAVIVVLDAEDIYGKMVVGIADDSVDPGTDTPASVIAETAVRCWAEQQVMERLTQY